MAKVVIREDRCKSCELCVAACARQCLKISTRMNPAGYFVVEFDGEDKCTGCALCGEMCPDLVLQVWK
jgi:2-oxoglutarate ferredoxin oxidoreductase subunit delta